MAIVPPQESGQEREERVAHSRELVERYRISSSQLLIDLCSRLLRDHQSRIALLPSTHPHKYKKAQFKAPLAQVRQFYVVQSRGRGRNHATMSTTKHLRRAELGLERITQPRANSYGQIAAAEEREASPPKPLPTER